MRPSLPVILVPLLVFAACSEPSAPVQPPTAVTEVALPGPPPPRRYPSVLLEGAPHVRQKPDFCGEACVEMATARLGQRITQDQVFAATGLDPALGRGAYTKEMIDGLKNLGFAVGEVFSPVRADRSAADLEASFAALHADLQKGIPSIVCMHYDERPGTTEHFRLVLGYDEGKDEVVYSEPAEDAGGYRRMPRSRFLALWPLKYDAARWTLIRLRLDPEHIHAPPMLDDGRFSPAAFAQHVMELKKRVPPGFTVVVMPPFVVVGDQRADVVRGHAEHTVEWAVTKLKQDFFTADPKAILDVWLFGGKASYDKHTRAVFHDRPTTPYGYYSSEHKALIMNIATGGGTLVHEIVHPFVEADFPDAPAWLNEGLGSLFEQADERDGHIIGRTNWRLAGLQKAIGRHEVPSFKALTGTTTTQFYEEDPGTNYSQARYLCYYLQEHGLLRRFYKEFRAGHAADPTGYETLQRVLGERDMDAFKARWEAWALRLSFP